MRNVRHVPGLKRNLISIGLLDDEGFVTTFVNGCWKITKGVMVIAWGSKMDTLYMTANDKDIVAVANSTEDSKIWHCRLGHMSEKGMKIMTTKENLGDLKSIDIGLCEDCIMGKQKKVTFSKATRSSKPGKLELVHTDVWGPAPVRSLGGSLY